LTFALAPLTQKLLEYLPPYEADDPRVQNLIQAMANELGRIDTRAKDIVWRMFPQNADDTYGTLGMWEALLNLPVQPAGVSLASRQSLVLSTLRSHNAGTGAAWRQLLEQVLGGAVNVTVFPPNAAYTITLRVPVGAGSNAASQARVLAARITPAHLVINSGFIGGFIIGISHIGDAL
jgi:uncharacterized protein YmfQ (DUF2313 family)